MSVQESMDVKQGGEGNLTMSIAGFWYICYVFFVQNWYTSKLGTFIQLIAHYFPDS